MFDLLGVIVQADPALVAAWMILALGLGMYPVGLLMPCSTCCKRECYNCITTEPPDYDQDISTGTPPNTITVTFPTWPATLLGQYRHLIRMYPSLGNTWSPPYPPATGRVTATDGGGAITAVEVLHSSNGYARVVGGVVEVDTPRVFITNASTGGCAPTLTPVIEDDENSPDFGKIISITITNGGCNHDYRQEEVVSECCSDVFSGRSFVLRRNPLDECEFTYENCEGFGWTTLSMYIGSSDPFPLVLHTQSGDECHSHWTATTPMADCDDFSMTLEAGDAEAVATVAGGGAYGLTRPCNLAACLDNCYTGDDCPLPPEVYGAGACRLLGPGGSYALCNESRKLSVTISGVVDDPDGWSGGGAEGTLAVVGPEPDGGAIAAALNNTFVFPSGQYASVYNANGDAASVYVDCWQHEDHGEFVIDMGGGLTITLTATSDWNTFGDGVRVIGVTVEVLYTESKPNDWPFYATQFTRSQTVALSDTPPVVSGNPCGCKKFYDCSFSGSGAMANGPETTADPKHFWLQGRFVDFSNATLTISLA